MSNTETRPAEMRCGASVDEAPAAGVEVLTARNVPLGGPRAMNVRRTLPQRARTLIGAWCFADHYGPDDVAESGGMDVSPHPHIGLQTVSWLFGGEIEHRDSLGTHSFVRPGELNLMTGGFGICHSEVSTPGTTVLHGVQLWVALPEEHRDTGRDFQHHAPVPVVLDGGTVRVFLGSLAGDTSPVTTFTPLLGAEVTLVPGGTVSLDVDTAFEHGVLVDIGDVRVDGTTVRPTELGYVPSGRGTLTLTNATTRAARLVLLGGPPFPEEIVMWWNFIGRSHDEIVQAREDWMRGDRFGEVHGYDGAPLPAPELPNTPLKPRRRVRCPLRSNCGIEKAMVQVPRQPGTLVAARHQGSSSPPRTR
ncbi:pirin family protein [Streptomyces mutabilis]|uniref:pirin family protein n=1 Tax=Streptomyces mutabilis TaxID=67332 RepID=UPI00177C423D|nr:pirin family protein [Streptomyces mutabilis]